MMKLDRGNKDQSPHKKVRSNHELDFRKNRLLFSSAFTMIPAILFLVFWADREDIKHWEFSLLTTGAGLIVLGCLYILFSLIILNKDTRSNNIISFALLFVGGLLYLIGSIGIAEDLGHNGDGRFFRSQSIIDHIGGPKNDHVSKNNFNVKDAIYWFGLFALIALDAIHLALDILTDIFFAQYLRIALWAWPLLFSTSFAFGVMLYYGREDLNWWELCGKAGFGTVAISNLLLMLFSLIKYLVKSLGTFLAFCSFLGSVLIWIYHAAYIKEYVTDASDACFYIGIPFLISAQSLFLMYDCFLGTKEPKDGAAAHTVHHPNDGNRDVRVPVH